MLNNRFLFSFVALGNHSLMLREGVEFLPKTLVEEWEGRMKSYHLETSVEKRETDLPN